MKPLTSAIPSYPAFASTSKAIQRMPLFQSSSQQEPEEASPPSLGDRLRAAVKRLGLNVALLGSSLSGETARRLEAQMAAYECSLLSRRVASIDEQTGKITEEGMSFEEFVAFQYTLPNEERHPAFRD